MSIEDKVSPCPYCGSPEVEHGMEFHMQKHHKPSEEETAIAMIEIQKEITQAGEPPADMESGSSSEGNMLRS